METVKELLQILTQKIKPPEGTKHHIFLTENDVLTLGLWVNSDNVQQVHFTESDLGMGSDYLAEDILSLLKHLGHIGD